MRFVSLSTFLFLAVASQAAVAQHDAHRMFTLVGPTATENFGAAQAVAGDINLDGCADIVIGARYANANAGAVYVFSGRNGALLYTFNGTAVSGQLGYVVSGAGDVDRDGFPDIVAGAPYANGSTGQVVVFSGRTGAVIWTLNGVSSGERFGFSVGDAGDVNRDGNADVIVGVPSGNAGTGQAVVFSGKDGKVLYTFNGDSAADSFGQSVDGAGDVNLDGFPDLVAGAPLDDNNGTSSGMVRLLSGKDGSILRSIDGAAGEQLGFWVSGGGDINRDAFADVVASAYGANRVDTYSGRDGTRIWGYVGQAGESFGWTCAGAGDVDKDGYADFIGGKGSASSTTDPGVSRVISGRTGQALLTFQGYQVGGGGDINGDGYSDVIAGTWLLNGVCWVYSGKQLSLRSDVHEIPLTTGGTQNLTLDAGVAQANRNYWIFGSVTGTKPGITLQGVDIPLNPDPYTDLLIANINAPNFVRFRGTLDANGAATAALQVPNNLPPGSITLYHAFLVYNGSTFYMASNGASVLLK
ncbi:MAG: FG-GAP repeat protein [Planctomycetes bacterium]|nr:FG-GAP repeat protein [Planctomycetota bacterium]MCB9869635.1 FG-GAP repeat protein [Planctomycetota bacterium]